MISSKWENYEIFRRRICSLESRRFVLTRLEGDAQIFHAPGDFKIWSEISKMKATGPSGLKNSQTWVSTSFWTPLLIMTFLFSVGCKPHEYDFEGNNNLEQNGKERVTKAVQNIYIPTSGQVFQLLFYVSL